MHGTALATETGAEFLKYAITLHKHAPEPVGIFGVVRTVDFIALERNRVLSFVWCRVDSHRQIQFSQRLHDLLVKFSYGLRTQLQGAHRAVAFYDAQFMINEIETNLECA